jgi:hypothetical protein
MTHRHRFGLRGVSLPLLCPLPGQNERAESAAVLHLSALATELVSALGSVSTGALSFAQARRLYHQPVQGKC